MQKAIYYIITILCFISCKKDIVIDLEDGEQKIGIYGSITTEYKIHTVTLSRSAGFYASGSPEMISGAVLSITDGTTIIEFEENIYHPGVYETIEPVAGEVGKTYTLSAHVPDQDGTLKLFTAQSTINPIPGKIDSAKVLPYTFNGKVVEDLLKICPYFQTLDDSEITYLVKIAINDVLITDTLTECSLQRMRGLSGLYFNGPEMQLMFRENFPTSIYNLDTQKPDENIMPWDKITIYMYSIENDYRKYITDIATSGGSNPFLGTPSNVRSNIEPKGEAVGYFYAASMIEYSFIYDYY